MPLTIAPKEWFMSKVELRTPELFRERCFVGGNWLDAGSHETLTVDNPATGEVIGRVPNFDGQDTAQAIAQAEQAFRTWRATTATERSNVLWRWHQLMEEHVDDLAAIITLEQGKPLAEADRKSTRLNSSHVAIS